MIRKTSIFITVLVVAALLFQSKGFSQEWTLAGHVDNPGNQPSISVVDWNIVWIADGTVDTPRVFRTLDGGQNWTEIPAPPGSKEIYCVWGINNTVCLAGEGVVSGNAHLWLTYDAGQNWSSIVQTDPTKGYFNGIAFQRLGAIAFNGLALAERIYRTTDGGYSWVMLQSGTNGVSNAHNSLFIVDNNFYGYGMNNGAARLRVTSDNGSSWMNQQLNITGSYTSAVAYKDDKLTGVAATSSSMPILGRTTDGGLTWSMINVGDSISGETKIKWIPGSNILYILGSNGCVKRSLDGGLTWVTTPTAGVTGLTHFDFAHLNNVIFGYAVSRDGRIIKLVDSIFIITGANNHGSVIPREYALEQNYPNPFNPVTSIVYALPQAASVKLAVYDVLGREVKVLVNEFKPAGKYNAQWNAGNNPSGVYFYTITAGSFTSTKKMILLK